MWLKTNGVLVHSKRTRVHKLHSFSLEIIRHKLVEILIEQDKNVVLFQKIITEPKTTQTF